jgi:hypothetical protein
MIVFMTSVLLLQPKGLIKFPGLEALIIILSSFGNVFIHFENV